MITRPFSAVAVAVWVVFGLAVATPALAQQGTVTGRVVHDATLRPLAGAQISIPGSGLGALANSDGRYLIVNVPPGQATLRVQIIGYASTQRTVTVVAGQPVSADFSLQTEALGLDEIVVTGTAGTIQRRAVANVVGTMRTADALERTSPASVQHLLTGQVPGVSVQVGSGAAGSGGGITIRGRSSVALGGQPLLYIDGVRANGGLGGRQNSRLNDINPEDIERIEIIKGPAAATLYGTEASAGVIQVITKRGAPGKASVEAVVRSGANWFNDPAGRLPINYAYVASSNSIISHHPFTDEEAAGRKMFRNGLIQSYAVNVRGGQQNIAYFLSGGHESEEGYLVNNDNVRTTVRTNVQSSVSNDLDVSVDLGIIRGVTRIPRDIDFGVLATHQFGSPTTKDTPLRGFSANPPEISALRDWPERLHRATMGTTVTHRPTSWLMQRVVWGLDWTDARGEEFMPRLPDSPEAGFYGFHGSEGGGQGAKYVNEARDVNQTLDYQATASFEPTSELTAATSIGAQYYVRESRSTQASSIQMPTPAVSTVSSGSVRTGGESYLANKTFGVFVQETVGWRNQLFLTAALRADANSAFGESFKAAYYPKLSGSWVVSDAFELPTIFQTLRLRAAWGRSGMQPDAFAATRTYSPSIGPGNVPTVVPGAIGNPDLKPEVGTELETGFDASLFQNRLSIEMTYYNKIVTDAILLTASAPSGGFASNRYVNAGQVDNTGWELGLTMNLIQSEMLSFELGTSVSTNKNTLADDGGLPPLTIDGRGRFQHIEGYPLGGNWSRRIKTAQWGGATGRQLVGVTCEGGPPGNLNPAVSELGKWPGVPCGNAPYFYVGNPGPGWLGSINPQLTVGGRLTVSGQFSWTYDRMRFSTTDWKRNNQFGNSLLGAQIRAGQADPILAASHLVAGVEWTHHMREDHFRMRDLSASYNLPNSWIDGFGVSRAMLSVSGRNLWTPYVHESFKDLDPEARHSRNEEWGWHLNPPPLPHSIVSSLRLTF